MLNALQQAQLEALVQAMDSDLYVEDASLDAHQTLALVLCRDTICFRPLRITMQEVDVTAALDGQAEAQRALQAHLRQALHGRL
jgi:hypothetical protein